VEIRSLEENGAGGRKGEMGAPVSHWWPVSHSLRVGLRFWLTADDQPGVRGGATRGSESNSGIGKSRILGCSVCMANLALMAFAIPIAGNPVWAISCKGPVGTSEGHMLTTSAETRTLKKILKEKEADLDRLLRTRDGIAIENSADEMDQIQYATERDMAIRNVDRDSRLLRQVRAALLRINDGSFGICPECESVISPKRLEAVPWAEYCIRCQDAADRNGQETMESRGGALVSAA
jgi:DnaK suppressor protein